jgi:hypothetical protein
MQFMTFISMALKFGVWCAVNAHKFITTIDFEVQIVADAFSYNMWLIIHSLWYPRSPDLNQSKYYF